MAVEVYAQRHLFNDKSDEDVKPRTDFQDLLRMEVLASQRMSAHPWRQNIIHDVESVWWVSAWVLHYFMHAELPVVDGVERRKFRDLFPIRGEQVLPRTLAFTIPAMYHDYYKPSTCPYAVHRIIGTWRTALVSTFRSLDDDLGGDSATYALDVGTAAAYRIRKELAVQKEVKSRFSN